ncbi:MAG: hypothetical protein ACLTLQ_16530 [[Clostridium] scindens]
MKIRRKDEPEDSPTAGVSGSSPAAENVTPPEGYHTGRQAMTHQA